MYDVLWANKQIEPFYTTMTLFLTSQDTGVVYRYEKAWRAMPSDGELALQAALQIDDLEAEIAANEIIYQPIIYEDGLEA